MAPMRPHERAASIREQLDRIFGDPLNPLAPPASSDSPANASAPNPVPTKKKKKPRIRSTALADAKNVLRAASAVTSKSLNAPLARRSSSEGGPQFIHRTPDIARHRRKCAVCHHPDREVIEDLFIHWHSPNSIASYYDDGDEESNERAITWVSIYRHAYAFGLDEIRRRNLRFVFELLLEQADQITPTSATLIAAARALGSCVNANGEWNEPPKRVIVTNVIRNEPPQPDPAAQIDTISAYNGAFAESERNNSSSFRALHLRDVVAGTPSGVHSGSFAGATGLRQAAQSEEVAKGGSSPSVPDQTDASSGQRSLSTDNQSGHEHPSGRASFPREVIALAGEGSVPAAAPPAFVEADRSHRRAPSDIGDDSSSRACPEPARRGGRIRERGDVVDPVPASLPPGLSASEPSPDIRNSLNSFNFKEPPISNR